MISAQCSECQSEEVCQARVNGGSNYDSLGNVTKAPLKPPQGIDVLRTNVILAVYHQCVVGDVTLGQLDNADKCTHLAVRRWCKLPNDTPVAYFHSV